MRPSQYHYIKRMWVRNSYKKQLAKKKNKLKKKNARRLANIKNKDQIKQSNYRLYFMIPAYIVFVVWTICVFLNINNILEQIGLLPGVIVYVMGLIIFFFPVFLVCKIKARKFRNDFFAPNKDLQIIEKTAPLIPKETKKPVSSVKTIKYESQEENTDFFILRQKNRAMDFSTALLAKKSGKIRRDPGTGRIHTPHTRWQSGSGTKAYRWMRLPRQSRPPRCRVPASARR